MLARVRPEQFETWFRRAALKEVGPERIVLAVQNSFALSWLETHYRGTLEEAAESLFGDGVVVTLEVDAELTLATDRGHGDALTEDTLEPQSGAGSSGTGTPGTSGPPRCTCAARW